MTVSAPLRRNIVESDEYTGRFAAVDSVEIRARVSGYLTEIHFRDGQMVKKGDLLFVIDPRPYDIALAAAQAKLAHAEARYEWAGRERARVAQLRERDAASQSVLEQREMDFRTANATLAESRAAVRAAELDLEFTRVTAPVAGRVGRHEVTVGNLVGGGASATLLSTIVSLDPIYFLFDMSEAEFLGYQREAAAGRIAATRDGAATVSVRLMDETEWRREGRINFVDNVIDRSSGTIRVRATFANADALITPGQFGRLRIPRTERYDALLLPDNAIVSDQAGKIVMTVASDGTVVPKAVRLGPLVDGLRVIRGGLESGDRVIVNGLLRARPGGKVTAEAGRIESPRAPD